MSEAACICQRQHVACKAWAVNDTSLSLWQERRRHVCVKGCKHLPQAVCVSEKGFGLKGFGMPQCVPLAVEGEEIHESAAAGWIMRVIGFSMYRHI